MPQPERAALPEWDSLRGEVRDLERRIADLERRVSGAGLSLPSEAGVSLPSGASLSLPSGAGLSPPSPPPPDATAALPLVGRALLGLAGAYLLRALTESTVLTPTAGAAIGILYAILWLVWAARTPADRRLATALHSLTAALVLAPLLWEATLRFHAVSTWAAGGILLFFTVFGLAVSWRKDLLTVATIVTLTGVGASAALLMATHDVLPFTLVFLAIAAAVEASACLDHWLAERWLAAAAADLSVLLATWLVTNPRGLPEAYAPIPHGWLLAAQAALLAIYLASIIVRTLLRGCTFTAFETAQCAAAFAIAVGGGLRLSHGSPVIGALALAFAAPCYIVAFARLEVHTPRSRNFYTYSTFGLLLALAGTRILLAGDAAAAAWSALALGSIWAGGRFARLTLRVHATVYLYLALAASGALRQATELLLGSALPERVGPTLWIGAALAALCYALAARTPSAPRTAFSAQAVRLALAAAFVWLGAGVAAWALTAGYHAAFGASASHAYCATLRTTALAGASLLLAWAGSRRGNVELSRLVYPVMALGACRLLMGDLHQDRQAALFLSLLIYGAALTALPKLIRAAPPR
jgi:hypothetical protein